jgi:O-antigen/teichoic acid export membrane protein
MSKILESAIKSAIKGTVYVFVGNSLGIVLWFAVKVLLAKNLSLSDLGIYSICIAVVGIMSSFASAGLAHGIARYVSLFSGSGRESEVGNISKDAFQLALMLGLVFTGMILFFARPIALHVFYKPELITPLRVISSFIFFAAATRVIIGIHRGHKIVESQVFFVYMGQPILFLLFLSIIFLFFPSLNHVLVAYVAAMAVIAFVSYAYGRSRKVTEPISFKGAGHKIRLLKFSLPLLGAALSGMLFTWTDTFMLARYTTTSDVGVYNIAISLAKLNSFILGAIGFMLMPLAGELYAGKKHQELKRTFQLLTKWAFSVTLPVFVCMFMFPEMVIVSLFGEAFRGAALSLRILSVGFMVNVLIGSTSSLLITIGKSRTIMFVSFAGMVINVILNYIMIKRLGMGITGAALATGISHVMTSIAYAVVLYANLKIQPLTPQYLRSIISMTVVSLVIYVIAKSIPLYFWMLPLYLLLFLAGYAYLYLLTRSIEEEDVRIFDAVMRRAGLKMKWLRNILVRYSG